MIRYFCDRCGKDLDKEKRIGYIAVNTKDKAEGDLKGENDFENCHYCASCTDAIKKFIRKSSEESAELVKEAAPKASMQKERMDEAESDSADDNRGGRKRIDTGKILALKNAGWSVKDIADEMHLTPQQVSSQLYLHKKKTEATVLMEPGQPGERPKL